jgi:uncharacterized repeat protein (TIGR01451 family)
VGSAVSDTDTASVDVVHPAIQIAKSPDTQTVLNGATATFSIAVTNTGDVALSNVAVSDPLVPDCDRDLGELAAGESQRYDCSLANATVDLTNTATAAGTPPVGSAVSDTDTASVDVVHPAIQIAKSPDTQTVTGGATATFTIAVTNTGDTTLTNVTISDPLTPDCDRAFAHLAPGGSQVYTCAFVDVKENFTNTATASGTPPIGPDVTDTDSAAVVKQNDTQACPADMSAYWRLDEAGGTTFEDYYDGHTGRCAGQCPIPTSGLINGAQSFDGANTGLTVPSHPAFDWGLNDSFSVEFWMQTDPAGSCSGSNQVIVGRDDPATSLHWWVGCQKDTGRARFYLFDTSDNYASVIGTTDLTDGNWHHVVAVREGGSGQTMRLYVDGLEQDSQPTSFTAGFEAATEINIGWLDLSSGFHFEGIIDEVALYDRALSPGEVEGHYNEGQIGRWYCQADTLTPTISSTPKTYAAVEKLYTYDVEAVGSPSPTYALPIKPAGMTIDPTTGLTTWTPSPAQEGEHSVQVEARNSEGVDTQSFTVTVVAGLVAYWKLDETAPPTYHDALNGHDGACAGNCPTPVGGQTDGAQAFDGANTGIDVPPHAAFDWGPDDSFSLEFWMQTDPASICAGNHVVVGRDDSASQLHWWVGCKEGGQAAFYLTDTGGQRASIIGTADLTDGNWHRITAVRDANAGQMRLYVDGITEGAIAVTFGNGFDSATAAVNIGWLNLSGEFHFAGILDEIKVFDTAISGTGSAPGDVRIFLPIVLKQ